MSARVGNGKTKPYRLKYRPDPIGRLREPGLSRLPMIGDPPALSGNWSAATRAIYEDMIQLKRRHGLWFWDANQ